jgi:arylsulfatase
MYSALYQSNKLFGQTEGKSTLSASLDERTLKRLQVAYRDSVRSVDVFIDRLRSDLDDAVLIFHSDHGEAFGEHGTFGHQPVLYDENIHVPLLVHGVDSTETIDPPVSTRSIPDLILQVARSESIGTDELPAAYVVARTLDNRSNAAQGPRWKYTRHGDDESLFDFYQDSNESTDIGDDKQDVRDELRERCESLLDGLPRETDSESGVVSREMKGHLQSVGYGG